MYVGHKRKLLLLMGHTMSLYKLSLSDNYNAVAVIPSNNGLLTAQEANLKAAVHLLQISENASKAAKSFLKLAEVTKDEEDSV